MATISSGTATSQQEKQKQAVLEVILKFFDGLRDNSAEIMNSTLLPNGHATLIRPALKDNSTSQVIQLSFAELMERLTEPRDQFLEENIALATWQDGDDGNRYQGRRTKVSVDHDLAVAWTPYEVRMGGKVIHVGTNIFNLLKMAEGKRKGQWVISGVADTARLC
jgi:hypothetical protein